MRDWAIKGLLKWRREVWAERKGRLGKAGKRHTVAEWCWYWEEGEGIKGEGGDSREKGKGRGGRSWRGRGSEGWERLALWHFEWLSGWVHGGCNLVYRTIWVWFALLPACNPLCVYLLYINATVDKCTLSLSSLISIFSTFNVLLCLFHSRLSYSASTVPTCLYIAVTWGDMQGYLSSPAITDSVTYGCIYQVDTWTLLEETWWAVCLLATWWNTQTKSCEKWTNHIVSLTF